MKRVYERPQMLIENFVPNEYVAGCWDIACDVGTGRLIECSAYPQYVGQVVSGCGDVHQGQVVSDDPNIANSRWYDYGPDGRTGRSWFHNYSKDDYVCDVYVWEQENSHHNGGHQGSNFYADWHVSKSLNNSVNPNAS